MQCGKYREFCWCDGTNISSFDLFPEEDNDKARQAVKLIDGNFPIFCDPAVRLVWFALASSTYLSINTNRMPSLWLTGFLDPACEAIEIRNLRLLDNQIKLPSSVDFIFSAQYLNSLTNMHYLSKTISTLVLEKEFHEVKIYDNRVVGRYKAILTTNFNGNQLPSEFTLEVYKLLPSGQSVFQKYHGKLNSITPASVVCSMPKLQYPIQIFDYRFSDVQTRIDNIYYTVSNEIWPSIDSDLLQTLFKNRKLHRALSGPIVSEAKIRLLPRLFLGFAIISFPLLVLLRWSKKRKQNNNHL
jgi:hypothetical protein